jgi:hypothetical protein
VAHGRADAVSSRPDGLDTDSGAGGEVKQLTAHIVISKSKTAVPQRIAFDIR